MKKDQLIATNPASRSAGFLRDCFLTATVSFHRFQIVVWTIVLGIVFVKVVHSDLAMPDFDLTMLRLMGLSSGTCIDFKSFAI